MLENRCKELSINSLYQGVRTKFEKINSVISVYNLENKTDFTLKNCAYIGDDILDIQCMKPIKEAGGMVGCPADAVEQVKVIADYIAPHNGGDGAVRDFIEWLI